MKSILGHKFIIISISFFLFHSGHANGIELNHTCKDLNSNYKNLSISEDLKSAKVDNLEFTITSDSKGTLVGPSIEETQFIRFTKKSLELISFDGSWVGDCKPATVVIANKKCPNNPSACADDRLCRMATMETGGRKSWVEMSGYKNLVLEAEKRGLSCGVLTDDQLVENETKTEIVEIKNTTEFIFKNTIVDEVNTSGTHYYGRTIVVEDFNNDGIKEILYMRLSSEYLVFQNKENNQKGIKLSKSPGWRASFIPTVMLPDKSVGPRWKVKFNGDLGCVYPSQIIPAHLNKDSFLDLIIACTGYDAPPFPGEQSLVLLSDGPNNYNVSHLSKKIGYYHDAATADFNNDGITDILLVDSNRQKLEVYLNNGDGKFTLSKKYFPQFLKWNSAYTVEILDVNDDGYFDIFLAGHEDSIYGGQPTIFLLGNKRNKFSNNQKIIMPQVQGYGTVLDVIKEGKNLFIMRTGSRERAYKGTLVQNVDIESLETINILENKNKRHVDRIFRKSNKSGIKKFGGLMSSENYIDFILDGKEIKSVN